MPEYHKIQTVYKRDPATKHKTLLEGEWALPEFGYLKDADWLWTEKVDGTNIRVRWTGERVEFGGRTNRADIPKFLYQKLQEKFQPDVFTSAGLDPMVLYGEGFGARIQKGGGNYIADGVDFVLFDAWSPYGKLWLERDNVHEVAGQLNLEVVPTLGFGSLEAAVEMVKQGFNSTWGDFQAEGLIMRPKVELRDRRGRRVIAKVKCKDFRSSQDEEVGRTEG